MILFLKVIYEKVSKAHVIQLDMKFVFEQNVDSFAIGLGLAPKILKNTDNVNKYKTRWNYLPDAGSVAPP